jgi:hypothetical protein
MGYFSLKDLGQTISLPAVLQYLTRNNWQTRREGMNIICEGPLDDNQRPIVKYLPVDESYSDYPSRLEELVAVLSILEERPAVEIAREMARSIEHSIPNGASLWEALIAELSRNTDYLLPGKDPKEVAMELRPILAKMDLPIQYDYFVGNVIEQAAFLASYITKNMNDSGTSKLVVWRLCELVLVQAGLHLTLSPDQLDIFYKLAREDDPDNPEKSRDWIDGFAKPDSSYKKKESKRRRHP